MSLYAIPSLLSCILCFGLGLFVISRNPKRLANISFCLSMFAILLQEIGSFSLLTSETFSSVLFWKKFSYIGEALIPGSWFLFSLIFARADYGKDIARWKPVIVVLFLLPIVSLSFINTDLFIKATLQESDIHKVIFSIGKVGKFFSIFLLISLVVILVNFENTLRASSWDKRWKIKFMLLGFGGIAGFLVYTTSQTILFSSINLQLIPVISSIIIIGGLLMLFSVVRHRLLDVDIFVSRYVVYQSVTVVIVGLYLLAVGLLYEGVQYFESRRNPFVSSLLLFITSVVLVVLLLSEGVRRKVKFFINRHFYKHKYEFRDKWMEVTEKIASKADIFDIQYSLIDLISETLGTRQVSVWLYDEKKHGYSMTVAKKIDNSTIIIDQKNNLIQFLKNTKSIFDINGRDSDEERANIYNNNKQFFRNTSASLCVPLLVEKKLVGLMTVGEEITGEQYVHDDFSLLSAVAKQAAIGILNAKLTEEITVSKEMEAFSKLSSFIMHDLKNATSMLSLVAQNAPDNITNPEFQNDLIDTIKKTTSRMKGLITRLSNISKDEKLIKESTNIMKLIGKTLKDLNPNSNQLVTVSILEKKRIPEVMLDQDRVQKVIINIVLNAYESFQGKGEIKINISSDNGFAVISISDNGPGIPEDFLKSSLFKPFKTTKDGGLGIGLFQSKEIIESHGGRIEVESKLDKGTTFKVYVPM